MKIVQADLPEGVYTGGISGMEGGAEAEKAYVGLDPENFPSFYAKIGEIEGYFAILGGNWCDGELTLIIEKGRYSFDGVLTNYEEAEVITKLVHKIENLAQEFSKLFQEADSYTVTFKFSCRMEFNAQGRKHLPQH